MKNSAFALLLFFSLSNAQITFEKGYFISNSGQKTECFIKNLDWKNNPTNFKYKLLLDDTETKEESIVTVSEFGIDNESTYKRFKVEIDDSSNNIKNLSISEIPIWKEETLFLKILVEGDAVLYEYSSEDIKKFFYQTQSIKLQQLIYLKYLSEGENREGENVNENNTYQKQIYDNVRCGNIKISDIKKLTYKKTELTNYFIKYNNCINPSSVKIKPTIKKGEFLLRVTPSINFVSLTIPDRYDYEVNINANNKTIFKIGFEGEYILPYNKNKWSVFIDPTYQKYENEITYPVKSFFQDQDDVIHIANIDYSSIEIPLGVRHYMFLNKASKLFINVAYVFGLNANVNISYDQINKYSNNPTGSNLAFGFGYVYKNTFSIEMRMGTTRNLLENFIYAEANYKSFGFILGYKIL